MGLGARDAAGEQCGTSAATISPGPGASAGGTYRIAARRRRAGSRCGFERRRRATSAAELRAGPLPGTRISLDSGLLELAWCRILLGAGSLGAAAASGRIVDTRLLDRKSTRLNSSHL